MKKGPFELIKSKEVYKNPWITVREDKVKRPDGKDGIFGVVSYGEGVCVLPMDKDKNVFLIKEYIYAIERYEYEFPAGGVDNKESSIAAAKRELLEEAGLECGRLVDLGTANPLSTIIKSPLHMFLALNCKEVGAPEEGIRVKKIKWEDLLRMVEIGEISNSETLSTILKAKLYFDKTPSLE